MTLGILQRIRLKHEAKRDARYGFGHTLAKWIESEPSILGDSDPPPVSNTIEEMVKSHHSDFTKTVLKARKRQIGKLHQKILREVQKLDGITSSSNAAEKASGEEIDEIKQSVISLTTLIDSKEKALRESREAGILLPTAGADSFESLIASINQARDERKELQEKMDKYNEHRAISTSASQKKEGKKLLRLGKLISKFEKQVNLDITRIEMIERKYDLRQSYYWKRLCRIRKISVKPDPFHEVCKRCSSPIINSSEIFKEEREYVSNITKRFFDE